MSCQTRYRFLLLKASRSQGVEVQISFGLWTYHVLALTWCCGDEYGIEPKKSNLLRVLSCFTHRGLESQEELLKPQRYADFAIGNSGPAKNNLHRHCRFVKLLDHMVLRVPRGSVSLGEEVCRMRSKFKRKNKANCSLALGGQTSRANFDWNQAYDCENSRIKQYVFSEFVRALTIQRDSVSDSKGYFSEANLPSERSSWYHPADSWS